MTIATIAKTTIELALIILLLTGYLHEEQVTAFERKAWRAICLKINKHIAEYERRERRGVHENVPRPNCR